jgi:anthranilate synthase component II
MILLIDNYDSFTYNLYHYVLQAQKDVVKVARNDQVTIDQIEKLNPKAIILSPGPCAPNDAGICLQIIKQLQAKYPIFGVCLGHQAIGQAFGGQIIKHHPMHGKISNITHGGKSVFKDIPSPFKATRYHSLIIEKETLPDVLEVTAQTEDGVIMGIKHKELNIHSVQFHPESIASEYGHKLIKNFVDLIQ